jgi:hypothetical protein
MMRRRKFLGLVAGGLAACTTSSGKNTGPDASASSPGPHDAAIDGPLQGEEDAQANDPCEGVKTIELYDCNAQALYLDETLGPLTGVILVEYIIAGEAITLEFWHGHGGQQHAFTLGAEQFAQLRRGERTYVTTTEVDSHQHTLFIDPLDPTYRVEGALPIVVTVVEC